MKKTIITSHDKATIALKALQETDTVSAIAAAHGVHPIQVGKWKKVVKEHLHTLFDTNHRDSEQIKELEAKVSELHRLIGVRDEELAWLQKKVAP